MSQVLALVHKDLRGVFRDGFLVMVLFYSLVIAVAARVVVGWVDWGRLDLYLAPAVALLGPMLLGTLLGFALIEEREQGTWFLLRVLPLSSSTVFGYYVLSATVLSFILSVLSVALYGVPVADWRAFTVMMSVSALSGPMVMLLLGSSAANKIEGMAVSKFISSTGLVAVLIFIVSPTWQLLGAWCPWYWLYVGLLYVYTPSPAELSALEWPGYSMAFAAVVAFVQLLVFTALLARRYTRLVR